MVYIKYLSFIDVCSKKLFCFCYIIKNILAKTIFSFQSYFTENISEDSRENFTFQEILSENLFLSEILRYREERKGGLQVKGHSIN